MKPLNPNSSGIGSMVKATPVQINSTQAKKGFSISDIVFIAYFSLTAKVVLCADTKFAWSIPTLLVLFCQNRSAKLFLPVVHSKLPGHIKTDNMGMEGVVLAGQIARQSAGLLQFTLAQIKIFIGNTDGYVLIPVILKAAGVAVLAV